MTIFYTTFYIIFCLLVTSCSSEIKDENASSKEAAAISVITSHARTASIPIYIEAIGALYPAVFAEVRPQANGMLVEVRVSEGQEVKKGDILFCIEPKPYEAKVREANAQKTKNLITLQTAKKRLLRLKSLADKDLIAKAEWEELEKEVAQAEAAIEEDEARLQACHLDLEYCSVRAPIDGRVGKCDLHPGHLVSQEMALVEISHMNQLMVEWQINEKELIQLPAAPLDIEIESLYSKELAAVGQMTFLDNHFDAQAGQILARGKLANPDQKFRPGQSVRVRIPVGTKPKVLLIPKKAIKHNQEGPYVYVVQKDWTVECRQIALADEIDEDVVVSQGLAATEKVVTEGHFRLTSGQKVQEQKQKQGQKQEQKQEQKQAQK